MGQTRSAVCHKPAGLAYKPATLNEKKTMQGSESFSLGDLVVRTFLDALVRIFTVIRGLVEIWTFIRIENASQTTLCHCEPHFDIQKANISRLRRAARESRELLPRTMSSQKLSLGRKPNKKHCTTLTQADGESCVGAEGGGSHSEAHFLLL